jgi:hypothetical protein
MNHAAQENIQHTPDQTDFGTFFYPRGFLVAAFPKEEDAKNVRRDLVDGGQKTADCLFYTSQAMAEKSQLDLDQNTSFFQKIGWSYQAVKIHLAAAQEGAGFLVIYAPDDMNVDRVMNVIRRVSFKFVHRYHSIAIEELK